MQYRQQGFFRLTVRHLESRCVVRVPFLAAKTPPERPRHTSANKVRGVPTRTRAKNKGEKQGFQQCLGGARPLPNPLVVVVGGRVLVLFMAAGLRNINISV